MVWRCSHQSESLLQNSVPLRRVPLLFFCSLPLVFNRVSLRSTCVCLCRPMPWYPNENGWVLSFGKSQLKSWYVTELLLLPLEL